MVFRAVLLIITEMLILSHVVAAEGGKTIRGRVFDTETGSPLPVAHVRVEGRLEGTITNPDGVFEIHIGRLPADIRATFIGYASERMHIDESSPDSLAIGLAPSPVVMEEIVATPEDPAVRIMREVIRRKKEWRKKLTGFSADGYSRVVVSNDTRIAMILESISKIYWDAQKGTKEVIVSKRQTRNTDSKTNFATTRFMPNLYDDNLDILGFNIMGLTHPDALDNYRFTLTGKRVRDGRTVYDIAVQPKKKLQPLFIGTLSVLDGDYAMIEAKVKPNDAVMFPPPFNNFDVSFEQQFDDFGTDAWLPCDVRTDGRIRLKLPGLKFPTMRYHQLTRFTGYAINIAMPDTLFRKMVRKVEMTSKVSRDTVSVGIGVREVPADTPRESARTTVKPKTPRAKFSTRAAEVGAPTRSTAAGPADVPDSTVVLSSAADTAVAPIGKEPPVDPAARMIVEQARTDSIFAASPMVIPYTAEEERAYASLDSTHQVGDAFKPSGFLARALDDGNKKKKSSKPPSAFGRMLDTITDPFTPTLGFNRVDGGDLGLRFSHTALKRFGVSLSGAYRTESRDWAYGAGVDYRWNFHGQVSAGVDYHDGTVARVPSQVYHEKLLEALALAGRKDYQDYHRSVHRGVHIEYTPQKPDATFALRFVSERHSSLEKAIDYAVFDRDFIRRPNPPVAEGRLRSLAFSALYGDRDPVPFGLGPVRRASFEVEAASPHALGGDFSFTRASCRIDWRFETFFRRRLMPNTLDIRFVGGYMNGDALPQRFGMLDGTLGVFDPFGTFRTLEDLPVEGPRYAAMFWEHNFRTVPFELAGLGWLAEKGIGVIVHGAAGRTWIKRGDLAGLGYTSRYQDGLRSEIGISVNGIFGVVRLDATKRLDAKGLYTGAGLARLF